MNEKFDFKKTNNTLKITVKGFYSEEDGKNYIREYENQVRGLNTPNMDLELDCTELSCVRQDVLPILKACFEMYERDNFKKVTTIVKESSQACLIMQLNRMRKSTNLNEFNIKKIN